MALWPFGKKDKDTEADPVTEALDASPAQRSGSGQHDNAGAATAQFGVAHEAEAADSSADAAPQEKPSEMSVKAVAHDAVNGNSGPFDGDSVDITEFDFSDFSVGILDLGSMKIALPKGSQVQVEMGENGPKMLHIVTKVGRITPVAFAAPRSAGQWASAAGELLQGIERDGLQAHLEDGPWGTEIVGTNPNGTIRIIGVEGPRWMLRMTLAAPQGMEGDLADLAREVIARTFVYRGESPILAGNSLPVTMPQQLVEQVRQAMEQRQSQAQQEAQRAQAAPERNSAEDEAASQLRELRDEQGQGNEPER